MLIIDVYSTDNGAQLRRSGVCFQESVGGVYDEQPDDDSDSPDHRRRFARTVLAAAPEKEILGQIERSATLKRAKNQL
jgi:hypothetical protein